jgi:hypothetical protein
MARAWRKRGSRALAPRVGRGRDRGEVGCDRPAATAPPAPLPAASRSPVSSEDGYVYIPTSPDPEPSAPTPQSVEAQIRAWRKVAGLRVGVRDPYGESTPYRSKSAVHALRRLYATRGP